MKTGIYGGSFNPVHNGHVRLAQAYQAALGLERMLVIPTRVPPHKAGDELADGVDRLEMCRLAFSDPFYQVSDLELRRQDLKSYTVDTLELLHARYPDDQLYLLMGSDMFLTLTDWHDWQRIFQLAVMCVGGREPDLRGRLQAHGRYLESLGAHCRVLDLEPFVVSSTDVRTRVRAGLAIDELVPLPVAEYIRRHQLYRQN